VAQRLAAGRNTRNLVEVMGANLFGVRRLAAGAPLAPARGLFATMDGADVYILAAFSRYRVPRADVIPLRPGVQPATYVARLRDVLTVEQRQLDNVGVHYTIVASSARNAASLTFHAITSGDGECSLEGVSRSLALTRYCSPLFAGHGSVFSRPEDALAGSARFEPRRIVPAIL